MRNGARARCALTAAEYAAIVVTLELGRGRVSAATLCELAAAERALRRALERAARRGSSRRRRRPK